MTVQAAPPNGTIRDGMRMESDSMGKVLVPADRYWGRRPNVP
jgi:hypothetical protein